MNLGIATCPERPGLMPDDSSLAQALELRGIKVTPIVWGVSGAADLEADHMLDAVLVRSTWDYHKHVDRFRAWIQEIEDSPIQLINSGEAILGNMDKSYLLAMQKQGISIVPSVLISQDISETEVARAIGELGWKDLVLKPAVSATAYLTFKVSVSDENLPARTREIRKHSDLIVQPFLPSIASIGEISLVFFNEGIARFSHAVVKIPRSGDFRVQSNFGGTEKRFEPSKQLIDFGARCTEKIEHEWDFARVDVVDWGTTPLLSELELIEPDLFLFVEPTAVGRFADALELKMRRSR